MARDLEHIARKLRDLLAGGERIRRLVPLSMGHSNETYLLEGLDRILRTPPSEEGLLPPYDMAYQHAVLAAVGAAPAGPPVPRVFELSTDASVIGDPFFVMERLPGEAFEYVVPKWLSAGDPPLRGRLCEQWIGAVTAIHRLPVGTIPGPVMTPRGEAEHWLTVARRAEAAGRLVRLLGDLAAAPPPISGSPTPVHGDPKLANCMWHEGRLAGLLDWEMSHVGEPLTDLGYLISFFDRDGDVSPYPAFDLAGWWDRARMVGAWEEATGRSATALRRYEALGMCKIAAILSLGVHLHRQGRASDPRFAEWAGWLPRYVTLIERRGG